MSSDNYWVRRMSRRRVLGTSASAGIGLASLGIVGCGSEDEGDSESVADAPTANASKQAEVQSFLYKRDDTSSKAVKGGTLTTYYTGDVTLDPLSATSYSSNYQTAYIYPTLLRFKDGL